jgi:hypothetical protein
LEKGKELLSDNGTSNTAQVWSWHGSKLGYAVDFFHDLSRGLYTDPGESEQHVSCHFVDFVLLFLVTLRLASGLKHGFHGLAPSDFHGLLHVDFVVIDLEIFEDLERLVGTT